MATHGTVKAFNEQSDDWPSYIERLQHYFIANDVQEEAKKRSILLTVCGATTYKLILSLAPVKLVKDYYNPKPSPIVQLQGSRQVPRIVRRGATRPCSPLRLRRSLSEMLRDRLIHGVNHKSIQRRLLAEPHDLRQGILLGPGVGGVGAEC